MFQTDLIFKSNLHREDDALFSGFWETCPRDCDAQILESTHYLLHGAGLVVENLRYMPLEHVLAAIIVISVAPSSSAFSTTLSSCTSASRSASKQICAVYNAERIVPPLRDR